MHPSVIKPCAELQPRMRGPRLRCAPRSLRCWSRCPPRPGRSPPRPPRASRHRRRRAAGGEGRRSAVGRTARRPRPEPARRTALEGTEPRGAGARPGATGTDLGWCGRFGRHPRRRDAAPQQRPAELGRRIRRGEERDPHRRPQRQGRRRDARRAGPGARQDRPGRAGRQAREPQCPQGRAPQVARRADEGSRRVASRQRHLSVRLTASFTSPAVRAPRRPSRSPFGSPARRPGRRSGDGRAFGDRSRVAWSVGRSPPAAGCEPPGDSTVAEPAAAQEHPVDLPAEPARGSGGGHARRSSRRTPVPTGPRRGRSGTRARSRRAASASLVVHADDRAGRRKRPRSAERGVVEPLLVDLEHQQASARSKGDVADRGEPARVDGRRMPGTPGTRSRRRC